MKSYNYARPLTANPRNGIIISKADTLTHYGVLGMKWGVRKERESAGRKTIKKEKPKSKHRLKLEEKYFNKGMSQEDAEKAAAKRVKVEKFLKVAAVITVAAATAYVARNLVVTNRMESGIQENLNHIFDTAKNNGITKASDIPSIKSDHDILSDLKAVNPRFTEYLTVSELKAEAKGEKKYNVWRTNCGFCATAFELRRRGLDVEAISNGGGMTSLTPSSFFKGAAFRLTSPSSAINDITKAGKEWGEGARGMVQVGWKGESTGHAFSFEIQNGIPKFLDAQTNDSSVEGYFKDARSVIFARLDDLELKDHITNAVKIKGRVTQ